MNIFLRAIIISYFFFLLILNSNLFLLFACTSFLEWDRWTFFPKDFSNSFRRKIKKRKWSFLISNFGINCCNDFIKWYIDWRKKDKFNLLWNSQFHQKSGRTETPNTPPRGSVKRKWCPIVLVKIAKIYYK